MRSRHAHGSGLGPQRDRRGGGRRRGGGTWSWASDQQTPDDSDAIVADGAGSFTVSLTLPSWYVPLYTVRATGTGSGLAETTFSDAGEIHYSNFEGEIPSTAT